MSSTLGIENARVLDAVQAMLGAITPEMQAVALTTDGAAKSVTLHVAATAEPDEELIEAAVADLNALAGFEWEVNAEVWVGQEWWYHWPARNARLIYSAYSPD